MPVCWNWQTRRTQNPTRDTHFFFLNLEHCLIFPSVPKFFDLEIFVLSGKSREIVRKPFKILY